MKWTFTLSQKYKMPTPRRDEHFVRMLDPRWNAHSKTSPKKVQTYLKSGSNDGISFSLKWNKMRRNSKLLRSKCVIETRCELDFQTKLDRSFVLGTSWQLHKTLSNLEIRMKMFKLLEYQKSNLVSFGLPSFSGGKQWANQVLLDHE